MKELTIELSGICNLDCIHCSHDREKDESIDYPELDKKELRDILDSYSDFEKIRISGGEPFHDSRLFFLAQEAKKRKKYVEVLSSGVYERTPEGNLFSIPENLLKNSLGLIDKISFSLYGSEEVHDSITQIDGSFKCLDGSVKLSRKYEIPFAFNFVALRDSIEGLEGALDYARYQSSLGAKDVSLRIIRFICQGSGASNPEQKLSSKEIKKIIDRVPYLENRYKVPIFPGCSFAEKDCRAGDEKAVVTSDGQYLSCSALKGYKGEVKPRSFPCKDRW